jgi:nitroimidazol reductase NimA-like FMN-containing flavoprotein (pyridoxamine 5'-phosphate oxidase superfamily)
VRYRGHMSTAPRPLSSAEVGRATELLQSALVCYLAMVEAAGPYVLPLNFAYVAPPDQAESPERLEGRIYFHTGTGRKTAALGQDPRVCMAFTGGVAFEQGDTPCGDGFSFRSLLVWGEARQIEPRERAEAALRWIVAKYDPGAVETAFGEADLAQTLVYEVSITAASFRERPR